MKVASAFSTYNPKWSLALKQQYLDMVHIVLHELCKVSVAYEKEMGTEEEKI